MHGLVFLHWTEKGYTRFWQYYLGEKCGPINLDHIISRIPYSGAGG